MLIAISASVWIVSVCISAIMKKWKREKPQHFLVLNSSSADCKNIYKPIALHIMSTLKSKVLNVLQTHENCRSITIGALWLSLFFASRHNIKNRQKKTIWISVISLGLSRSCHLYPGIPAVYIHQKPFKDWYRKVSNIRCTKSQNLNASRLIL